MWTLLISCLIHSFLDKVQKNQKPVFQNFKFPGFWYATLIGWILYTFQDTSYKIRLVSRLRKREDQALISISTILKFPALMYNCNKIYVPFYGAISMEWILGSLWSWENGADDNSADNCGEEHDDEDEDYHWIFSCVKTFILTFSYLQSA